VGGQPTVALDVDLLQIARACGYPAAWRADSVGEIHDRMAELRRVAGPVMLEIRVNKGARADLGRPKATPAENKRELMRFLGV
jgi:phosphonopyruvate decarboxylase